MASETSPITRNYPGKMLLNWSLVSIQVLSFPEIAILMITQTKGKQKTKTWATNATAGTGGSTSSWRLGHRYHTQVHQRPWVWRRESKMFVLAKFQHRPTKQCTNPGKCNLWNRRPGTVLLRYGIYITKYTKSWITSIGSIICCSNRIYLYQQYKRLGALANFRNIINFYPITL